MKTATFHLSNICSVVTKGVGAKPPQSFIHKRNLGWGSGLACTMAGSSPQLGSDFLKMYNWTKTLSTCPWGTQLEVICLKQLCMHESVLLRTKNSACFKSLKQFVFPLWASWWFKWLWKSWLLSTPTSVCVSWLPDFLTLQYPQSHGFFLVCFFSIEPFSLKSGHRVFCSVAIILSIVLIDWVSSIEHKLKRKKQIVLTSWMFPGTVKSTQEHRFVHWKIQFC